MESYGIISPEVLTNIIAINNFLVSLGTGLDCKQCSSISIMYTLQLYPHLKVLN